MKQQNSDRFSLRTCAYIWILLVISVWSFITAGVLWWWQ